MSIKKNIFYNIFLTTGLYVSQLVTFPYVTRVLGVASLGICNFVSGFVNFFVLVSSLGILTLGAREIAKHKDNRPNLDKCFSCLFYLLAVFTAIALLVYVGIIFFVSDLERYSTLLYIGFFYILFNNFIVDWFFNGIENFKYIAYRTLLIRLVYVAAVFVLIRNEDHYIRYYLLSAAVVFANAAVNWTYRRKFVRLVSVSITEVRKYLKSFVVIGIQVVLLSYYNTVNPVLLGFMGNDTEVGFYTIAIKLSLIILLVYNAYTLVMLPRLSSLVHQKNDAYANYLVGSSFKLLYIFSIPLIILVELFVPEIVLLVAGSGYEGAVNPMRISIFIILIGGISQIMINQVLIPNNMEKGVLIAAVCGVGTGFVLNLLLIPEYMSNITAASWIASEVIIIAGTYIYAKRRLKDISLKLLDLIKYLLVFVPLTGLFGIKVFDLGVIYNLVVFISVVIVYSHMVLKYILRDSFYMSVLDNLKSKKITSE